MEKISSKEAVASRLKQKEEEISQRLQALQDEVTSTGEDVRHYLRKNPWIGIGGSVLAGIVVGLIAGKKSKKEQHKERLDTYIDRLTQAARDSGVSDRELSAILRDALHETISPLASQKPPKSKSTGLAGMVMGMALDLALGFAKKSLTNFLDEKSAGSEVSEMAKKDDFSQV